jgi:hypothetical protein
MAPPFSTREDADFQNVLQSVEQSRVPFFFIAINPPGTPATAFASFQNKAIERMQTLASRSGGRVLFPQTIHDVASLYENIACELTASYSLAYGATRPQQDGTYRRIQVRLKNAGFRVSQSREGYYAGSAGSTLPAIARPSTENGPVLLTPIVEALLSPPEKSEWHFSWEEVHKAVKYEIEIYAPNVAVPVLQAQTRVTRYLVGRGFRGPIVEGKGWSWKLRAQHDNGEWSPWSETRPFDVFR